jgi:hypothetical protein
MERRGRRGMGAFSFSLLVLSGFVVLSWPLEGPTNEKEEGRIEYLTKRGWRVLLLFGCFLFSLSCVVVWLCGLVLASGRINNEKEEGGIEEVG